MADPDEYYKSDTLNLYFKSETDCSVDEAGAIKYSKSGTKKLANTHGTWVQQAQKDLVALGYLAAKGSDGKANDDGFYGPGTVRAVRRFQRHAARVFRMDASKQVQDVAKDQVFAGAETGVCDAATAKEIRKWVDGKLVNPVGRLARVGIAGEAGTSLNPDAAKAWEAVMKGVADKGGSLKGPYGDTFRGLGAGGGAAGSALYSLHHLGRAVDMNQGNKVIVKDPKDGRMFFRVFQKTAKQDGTEGTKLEAGAHKAYDHKSDKESSIAAGFYLELTVEIQAGGDFVRIPAQNGWDDRTDWEAKRDALKQIKADPNATAEQKAAAQTSETLAYTSLYNKQEWWHFQYLKDMQKTWLDELELIGFAEKEVRAVKFPKKKTKPGEPEDVPKAKWPNDVDLDAAWDATRMTFVKQAATP